MTYRPKVARDAASLFTPAQADAIESLELDAERDAPMAERLLAMLGITLEADEDADADAEHVRRQEHADYERSRGVL